MEHLGFPGWIRATHALNIVWMSLLVRSGAQVLAAHPRLYWRDASRPGDEWLKLSRKTAQPGELFTSHDAEEAPSPWVALPGGRNLGLGRHWHLFSVLAWVLTGLTYLVLLVVTPEWRRLVPTSWAILPQAWHTLLTYLSLRLPPDGNPYNPLQQLTYFAVVFLLGPLAILSGAAMSPALGARFPRFPRLFGGHQGARSVHFLTMLAFVLFTLGHVALVAWHGFGSETAKMVFGRAGASPVWATAVTLLFLALLLALHVLATRFSLARPRRAQHLLGAVVDPVRRALLHRLSSRQHRPPSAVTGYFWVNGRPPEGGEYGALARDGFQGWVLRVGGLVERELTLSLDDLRGLPYQSQVTEHRCIQGWSGVAQWGGVPLGVILDLCRPLPRARLVVFHAYDDKAGTDEAGHGPYYETLDLALARHPQTLLAYEMNGQPLPPEHGAPLRLRAETQYGFKMVKYLRAIEFVEDARHLGRGQGGWREDTSYYSAGAEI